MSDVVKTIADLLVASGTLALATFTAVLAHRTRQLAQEGREERKVTERALEASNRLAATAELQLGAAETQAEVGQEQTGLTRRALQASIQPMLVDIPASSDTQPSRSRPIVGNYVALFEDNVHAPYRDISDVVVPDDTGDAVHVSVPLRNIGPGPALITGVAIYSVPGESRRGRVSNAVVATGEATRFNFTIPKGYGIYSGIVQGLAQGSIDIEARYTDAAGENSFRTRARIHSQGDGYWYVRQVLLYWGADEDYFAASGPVDDNLSQV